MSVLFDDCNIRKTINCHMKFLFLCYTVYVYALSQISSTLYEHSNDIHNDIHIEGVTFIYGTHFVILSPSEARAGQLRRSIRAAKNSYTEK